MYLSGVYIGQYKVLLELYLRSVPSASDLVYACVWPALVAEWHLAVGVGVRVSILLDGWMRPPFIV